LQCASDYASAPSVIIIFLFTAENAENAEHKSEAFFKILIFLCVLCALCGERLHEIVQEGFQKLAKDKSFSHRMRKKFRDILEMKRYSLPGY
jgi:hypothetical protein